MLSKWAVCLAPLAISPLTASFSTTDAGQGTDGTTLDMAKVNPTRRLPEGLGV